MNIFKWFFLILLFLTNAFAGNTQHQDTTKPNIIFILTDDYANNLVDFMPNLKAMQREGVTLQAGCPTTPVFKPIPNQLAVMKSIWNRGMRRKVFV